MYSSFVSAVKDVFQKDFIPLHEPILGSLEKRYLEDAIDSTFVSSVGEYVNKVELELASHSSTKRAVAVVNGTSALHIALKACGVTNNDLVLTQALTFVATANAISYCGASPVFLDVDLDTLGLSPRALEAFLSEHAIKTETGPIHKTTKQRIAACVPMHTFGFMVDMDPLLVICKEWNITVVEDAAEAFGSSYRNTPAGSMGLAGTLSFNGNKIITAGGGGAVLTSDDAFANNIKHLTTTAKVPHSWEYVHDEVGYNYRMPNLNAALLMGQLERFNEILASKKKLFSSYMKIAEELELKLPKPPQHTEWNHWLMAIELNSKDERDEFLKSTNEHGVMTRPIWKLLCNLPMYQHCLRDGQENASYLEERVVNIPSNISK